MAGMFNPSILPLNRMRPRLRVVVLASLGLVVIGVGWWTLTQAWMRQRAFLERFETSFTSGTVQLLEPASVEEVRHLWVPNVGKFFRPHVVHEYVVTAKFERGNEIKWGRWLYTCIGDTGRDAVYRYACTEAGSDIALRAIPRPYQNYLASAQGWDPPMIDGIPFTAGPSASIVSVNSPIPADRLLIVKATAPAGTRCSLVYAPEYAFLSQPPELSPQPDGSLTWECQLNPRMIGGSFQLLVKCVQARGKATLENHVSAPNVVVLPAAGGPSP